MARLIDIMTEEEVIGATYKLTGAYCGGLIKDALERCVSVLNNDFKHLDNEQKEEMIVRMEHIMDDPEFGNMLRVLMGYPERPLSEYRPGMEEAYMTRYYVD